MTVSTSNNTVVYRGNGSATAFAVPFKVLDEDHLVVTRRVYATGVEDHTYIGTDYSYSGIGDSSGTLTLAGAALSDTYELVIERIVPYTQDLDIVNAGGFYPESVEEQLDVMAMGMQQLAGEVARSVRVMPGDNLPELGTSPARDNTVIGFDDDGDLTLLGASSFKGDPGSNIAYPIGAFTLIQTMEIPDGYDRIWTTEYSVGAGIGGATYIADDTVDAAYVAAHPTLTVISADGRGWRIADPVIDITQAGILPGTADALATANSDATEAFLAYLLANEPNTTQAGTAAIKITAPAGYFRFARKWDVKQAIWIEGQSNSQKNAYATQFDFNEAGFVFNRYNTIAGGVESPATTGADGYRVENLMCTSRAATGTGFHGLHAVCRGDVKHCVFSLFPGDGIRVETPNVFGVTDANANSTRILYCQFGGNGGCGINLVGGDANCIVTEGCDFASNGEYGLLDNTFLSNSHTGHHAEGNGLGLVTAGHKISAVSSACYYPVTAWASGATIAISVAGTIRANAGKIYILLIQGGGTTANAPTHTTVNGVLEADGYKWGYLGAATSRRYHVVVGQAVAASTTEPGTNEAVWMPYEYAGASTGIPLWVSGMEWKNGGSYGSQSTAGDSVWTACYSEAGQPPPQIRSPALFVGGQTPPSLASTGAALRVDLGSISNRYGFTAARRFYDGNNLKLFLGNSLHTGLLMAATHTGLWPDAFIMGAGRDIYFRLNGQATDYITLTGATTTFTGGRTAAVPNAVWIPNLFIGATESTARQVTYAAAAPVAGYHAAGEIVYNLAPSAGGKVGWVCVTAGTPGTWKAFGAIDA